MNPLLSKVLLIFNLPRLSLCIHYDLYACITSIDLGLTSADGQLSKGLKFDKIICLKMIMNPSSNKVLQVFELAQMRGY
jgi:hypothetical protein